MGLFSKKKKEVKQEEKLSLAELPKLPELPPKTSKKKLEEIHKLPSFPSSSFGKKFSQDSIKEAVKGGDKIGFDQDDSEDYEEEMVGGTLPLKSPRIKELEREVGEEELSKKNFNRYRVTKEAEPIFIRIDKFQEGVRILDETKRKISEIEHVLGEIKRTREREEEELTSWESNIKSMKNHIGKVERDVFSNI